MPRNARTIVLPLTADALHKCDQIVNKDGSLTYVAEVSRRRSSVTVTAWDGRHWTVPADRIVKVRAEAECSCSGTGVFRGGGVVENGVYKGYEGVCYGCAGKGWQDRKDMIRNHTYWAKYARVSA